MIFIGRRPDWREMLFTLAAPESLEHSNIVDHLSACQAKVCRSELVSDVFVDELTYRFKYSIVDDIHGPGEVSKIIAKSSHSGGHRRSPFDSLSALPFSDQPCCALLVPLLAHWQV